MKGFFIFLGITLMLMAGYIYYNLQHPSETMIVRQGAQWTTLEYNQTR